MPFRVLLAEDEKLIAVTLVDDLEAAGYEVEWAPDGVEAWDRFQKAGFDCVISDINMPGMNGMELLRRVKGVESVTGAETDVVLITGAGGVRSAVEAMKLGAYDYIEKPFQNDQVLLVLEKLDELRGLRDEIQSLRGQVSDRHSFDSLIGKSRPMQEVYELIRAVADTEANVLIVGETGTGKELVARAIHHNSSRKSGPLVTASCAIYNQNLLEDELFGHAKGAFTDAREDKVGRFQRADGGSIFLDDIDDIALETQVKLLRAIQFKEIERLGSGEPVQADFRVIAATKFDLELLVQENRFREDLFFRLNIVRIDLPPLRDREGDIPILLEHFIQKYSPDKPMRVKPDVVADLCHYPWPGNVRELEGAVERAVILSGKSQELKKEHLLRPALKERLKELPSLDLRPLKEVLSEREVLHIRQILKHNRNQKKKSAEILGISRKSLWEKMREYGIE